MHSDFA
jgi:hypothetical protein